MSQPNALTKLISSDESKLFLSSALSLFLELLLIRYSSIEIHILAYFKNLALMACFLGLGLGFAWSGSAKQYFKLSAIILCYLLLLLSIALLLHWNALTFADPYSFMLFGVNFYKLPSFHDSAIALGVILLVFTLTTWVFVGIGQYIGALFDKFTPLKAYSINVGGALCGSLLFTLLCSLETPPGIWIALAGIIWLLLGISPARIAIVAFGIAHLFLVPYIAHLYYGQDYATTLWSPYYRIDVVASRQGTGLLGYDLKVNYDTFQTLLDCSKENLRKFPLSVQQRMLAAFSRPYDALHIHPKKVLVLASGNGCDVAAALRNGAEEIDAVDIDPVLTRLGSTMHPERPYLDPRVHLHVMDARTYLQTCKKKYDLIQFAYLDSHTAFSALSSLRTDNYIFTVESYKQAINLLNDDGIVFVDFIAFKPWLWNRQTNALALASGQLPVASFTPAQFVGVGTMAAGPGLKLLDASKLKLPGELRPVNTNSGIPLATDDWPFLFLPTRALTLTYAMPLLLVLTLSALFIGKELRLGTKRLSNWLMLGLGMGFMLLEVRAMADLSLLFGSTWIVNAAVISTVLVMILVGNFIATHLQSKRVPLCTMLLILSLFVSTLAKPSDLLTLGPQAAAVAGMLLYLFPTSVASVLFALLFRKVLLASEALAFNIFGGVLGVGLEYLSMVLGVHALGWIAMGIYATILAALLFTRKTDEQPAAATN
jgi:hypothetical protein